MGNQTTHEPACLVGNYTAEIIRLRICTGTDGLIDTGTGLQRFLLYTFYTRTERRKKKSPT